MISVQNILVLVAAATVYFSWSLFQEDKDTIRKLVFLIFLVGLSVLTLLQLSLDLLRSRIQNIEELVLPNQRAERILPQRGGPKTRGGYIGNDVWKRIEERRTLHENSEEESS